MAVKTNPATVPEVIHVTAPEASDKDRSFQALLAEIFRMARNALVDLSGNQVAVATYQLGDAACELTTRRPLSTGDLDHIKRRLRAAAEEAGLRWETETGWRLNGSPASEYHFDGAETRVVQDVVVPIAGPEKAPGLLLVAGFDPDLDLHRGRLVQQFSGFISRALRHLWYLQSRQKEQYELLASRVVDGVILCDTKKRIKFINPSALRILGLEDGGQWIGRPLRELEVQYLIDNLDEALRTGIFELNRVMSTDEAQKQLIGLHIELLKNARNTEVGWMIVLRDVTKNWQHDQIRTALSVASHEIKTPLHSMLGAVDLLLENDLGELNKNQRHCLTIIRDDIERLNRLIADILDLSRFDEGVQFLDRRNQIVLSLLVSKVIDSFRIYAGSKNVKLKNRVPRSLPTFKGNRDRLQQVIVNLVENAIKYCYPGGSVSIGARLTDSALTCWIQDTGVGIPENKLESVFERFVQLDNHPEEGKQGNGLGLAIAKQIVEAIGGRIWVESEVGVGSTFYFTIPV